MLGEFLLLLFYFWIFVAMSNHADKTVFLNLVAADWGSYISKVQIITQLRTQIPGELKWKSSWTQSGTKKKSEEEEVQTITSINTNRQGWCIPDFNISLPRFFTIWLHRNLERSSKSKALEVLTNSWCNCNYYLCCSEIEPLAIHDIHETVSQRLL